MRSLRTLSLRTLALSLFLALTACAPKGPTEPLEDVERDQLEYKEEKYWKDGDLFTGRMIKRHGNGELRSRSDYWNGVLHGLVEEFGEDGKQKAQGHFLEGTRHGKNTYWHPDGSLMKEQWYKQGKEVEGKTVHYKIGEKPGA